MHDAEKAISITDLANKLDEFSDSDLNALLSLFRALNIKILKELGARSRSRLRLDWVFIKIKPKDN